MFTTGLKGLDTILQGILPGDNLVWTISDSEEYRKFVLPFARAARQAGKKVTYFRFADHPVLLEEEEGIEIIPLNPHVGFEKFVTEMVDRIEERGNGS